MEVSEVAPEILADSAAEWEVAVAWAEEVWEVICKIFSNEFVTSHLPIYYF